MSKLTFVAAGIALTAAFAGSALATPTTSFTLSGAVVNPGIYDTAALSTLPSTTETETYTSKGSPVTDTFTGPTLWNVLQSAGGIATDPTIKNDVLRSFVVATGSDGYKTVISSGEINPKFGNKPDLVAYQDTNGQLPNPDGFARTVAAGDKAGGRYVSNLTDLSVGFSPAQAGTGGGTTSQFTVQGGVANSATIDLAALEALKPYVETVSYSAGGTSVTDTYTGVLLWDLLNSLGIDIDSTIKNDILRKLVIATGSDGYQVDFSLGEIDPAFGNEPILVAYSDTAGQLSSGGDGFARIVVPGDNAGGRYVSNLASLTVFDPTAIPEPSSLVLLAMGIGTILVFSNRLSSRG